MTLLFVSLIGLALGHLVRRVTPHVIGYADTSLPFRYPFVEIIAAGSFFLVTLERGAGLPQSKWLLFCLLLLTVGSTDALTKYINATFCYVGTVLGIILTTVFPEDVLGLLNQVALLDLVGLNAENATIAGAILAVSGAIMGWVQIEFIRRVFKPLVNVEVMGGGDGLLMLMVGAFLGPRAVLFALFPACILGLIIGGIRLVLYKVHHAAFGPAIAGGALFISLYGSYMVDGIGAFHGFLYELPPIVLMIFSLSLVVLLLVMLVRLKKKGQEWGDQVEEDYQEIDKKMKHHKS